MKYEYGDKPFKTILSLASPCVQVPTQPTLPTLMPLPIEHGHPAAPPSPTFSTST